MVVDATGEMEAGDRKLSRAAIWGLVLGVLSVPLLPLYPVALAFCVFGASRIKKSGGRLKGMIVAAIGIFYPIIMYLLLYSLWSLDAPLPESDYTLSDLRSVAQENLPTYDLLMQLADDPEVEGIPTIGLTEEDLVFLSEDDSEPNSITGKYAGIRQQSEQIKSLWVRSQPGRRIIEALSQSSEIADLTPPDIDATFPFTASFKYLVKLYRMQTLIEIEESQDPAAANSILEFDAAARKLAVQSRSLVPKLVCYAVFTVTLDTLNMAIQHPDAPEEMIRAVYAQYSPYTADQLSLRNCWIFEYLMFRNEMKALWNVMQLDESREATKLETPLYKENSMTRLYESYIDALILMDQDQEPPRYLPVSVWPGGIRRPRIDFMEINGDRLPWYYLVYNPIGGAMTDILRPSMSRIIDIKRKIVITEDLFRIVLALRLGESPDWTASYYEDYYHVDLEKKIIYCVGPDGQAFTDDDISLPIEPAVLGLTSETLN